MEKITVIIPAYNVEKYIEECILSVINQTYTELEIIIVDDGSTDSTGKICDSLSKEDSRIIVIHQDNSGVGFARNAGMKRASGDYICFLDADDFLPADAYEYMLTSLKKYNADLFIGEDVRTDEMGVPLSDKRKAVEEWVIDEREFWKNRNLQEKFAMCTTKLYPRKVFSDVMYGKYPNHEDQGVLWQFLSKCEKIVVSNKVVYFYRMRSTSIIHLPFSLKDIALSEALIPEIDYFKSKGWYDLMMYSWGFGTRKIAEGYKKLNLKDKEVRLFLKKRSSEYIKYAKILCGKVKTNKDRMRLYLYIFSPRLYCWVKNKVGDK